LFVLRGLPFMRPGSHYVNCLLLKIKFWFIALCLLMALSLITISYTDSKILYFVMIPFASLLILKCKSSTYFNHLKVVLHALIYRRVKYKDDGRDLVTVADFVALHVTFPFINAWVSYQIVYVSSIALCAMCPDKGAKGSKDDWSFCKKYVTADTARFYYILCVQPSKAAFALIFVEMSLYLTYYKDVIFSLLTLVNFVGMLIVSYEQLS